MRKYIPCPRCGAILVDSYRYCDKCGMKQEDEALTADYEVSFESIHANVGHFGHSVRYFRSSHTVLEESWGTGAEKESRTVAIPESVQTRRALNAYLDRAGVHR